MRGQAVRSVRQGSSVSFILPFSVFTKWILGRVISQGNRRFHGKRASSIFPPPSIGMVLAPTLRLRHWLGLNHQATMMTWGDEICERLTINMREQRMGHVLEATNNSLVVCPIPCLLHSPYLRVRTRRAYQNKYRRADSTIHQGRLEQPRANSFLCAIL